MTNFSYLSDSELGKVSAEADALKTQQEINRRGHSSGGYRGGMRGLLNLSGGRKKRS